MSAVPVELTARLAPQIVGRQLEGFLERDAGSQGGAIIVFLGVPESEVKAQEFTHHQLLQEYEAPLGNGNNMFLSVSAAGDTESAPPGFRSVMISTHCDLEDWQTLSENPRGQQTATLAASRSSLGRGRVDPGNRALALDAGPSRLCLSGDLDLALMEKLAERKS